MRCSVLLLLLLLLPGVHAVEVSFSVDEITIFFDKPKGSVTAFNVTKTVTFSAGNDSKDISGIHAYVSGLDIVDVVPSQTSVYLEAHESRSINLTFSVPSDTLEGVYSGVFKISTDIPDVRGESDIDITILYPNATLEFAWDSDIGNLKAGGEIARTVTVSESMGYKSADNVKVKLNESGPAEFEYDGNLGNFTTFGTKSFEVNIKAPERNLTPGVYNVTPIVTADDDVSVIPSSIKYVIPFPKMVLSEFSIDFGKITFISGKDSAEKTIKVEETGGYTPIEGLRFVLLLGDSGWISYNEDDYIPPNSSKEYIFRVFLPQDNATLGKKEWLFRLNTNHAGIRQLSASTTVYYPEIDSALEYLRGVGQIGNYTESNTLIDNAVSLLDTSRGITDVEGIIRVMAVYSGTITFLNSSKSAVQSLNDEGFSRSGDELIRANAALKKIEVGDESIKDETLKTYSSRIVESARNVWNSATVDILAVLLDRANESESSNYKFATMYYQRISSIYSLLGDDEKAGYYSSRQKIMEEKYKETLRAAVIPKSNGEEKLYEARKNMVNISGSYLILNPFLYDSVMQNYMDSIKEYSEAETLYERAGESNDADSLAKTIEGIVKEGDKVKKSFIGYGAVLVLLFIGFLVRVGVGFQNFNLDEDDEIIDQVLVAETEKPSEKPSEPA